MGNRTILITGAAGGLGSALSQLCAQGGFNTVMLDNDQRGLERAWDHISAETGTEPVLFPLDLAAAGPEAYDQMTEAIEAQFGGLDALVNCAARFAGLMPSDQIPPPEWLMQIQVNLNAAWLLSVHCLPLLRRSPAAKLYFLLDDPDAMESAFWGAYGVSKHALRAMARQWDEEYRAFGLQVLGIDPGPMRTRLRAQVYHAENPADVPSPATAAAAIMRLLNDEVKPASPVIDLFEQ